MGLGLFAKIPCLAKMLVLDFISVTGVPFTKHHKKCLWIITDLHLLFYIAYIYIKRSCIHLYIDNFAFEAISCCMNLHHPAVITAAHSLSVSESLEVLHSG